MAQGPGKLPNGILAKLAFEWRGSDVTSGADGKLFIAPYLTGSVESLIRLLGSRRDCFGLFGEDRMRIPKPPWRAWDRDVASKYLPNYRAWRRRLETGEIPFATTPC